MTVEKERFIVTEKGRRTAVVLPLKHYRELLEDLEDLTLIAERRAEPAEPLEVVRKRLERKWRSTGSK